MSPNNYSSMGPPLSFRFLVQTCIHISLDQHNSWSWTGNPNINLVFPKLHFLEISEMCAIGRSKLETAIIISISPLRVKFSCLLIQAAWVKWQLDFKVAPLNNNCLWKKKFPNNRNNGRTLWRIHKKMLVKNWVMEKLFIFWNLWESKFEHRGTH